MDCQNGIKILPFRSFPERSLIKHSSIFGNIQLFSVKNINKLLKYQQYLIHNSSEVKNVAQLLLLHQSHINTLVWASSDMQQEIQSRYLRYVLVQVKPLSCSQRINKRWNELFFLLRATLLINNPETSWNNILSQLWKQTFNLFHLQHIIADKLHIQ